MSKDGSLRRAKEKEIRMPAVTSYFRLKKQSFRIKLQDKLDETLRYKRPLK